MKITMMDRMILSKSLLGGVGNYEYLLARKDILDKVDVSQKESKKYKFSEGKNGNLKWECEEDFEYEFTSLESDVIRKELAKLSKAEKLTSDHMNLYKLFVLPEEAKPKKK